MKPQGSVGLALVKISALYLMVALLLGLVMAVSEDFSLMSVHSHLGLLGWAAMGLTGVIYLVLPSAGSSPLAVTHFWLHNLGLPVMMIGLTVLHSTGDPRAEPVVGLGSIIVLAALGVFTVNLFRNSRSPEPE